MNPCKTLTWLSAGIIALTTLSALGAETIEIDRVFSFSSHQYTVIGPGVALVTDTYALTTDSVIFDSNSYDQLKLTLSPGAGKRLVVDDVGANVNTTVFALWKRDAGTGSYGGVPFTVAYTNGVGTLPGGSAGFFLLTPDGSRISSVIDLTEVTNGFAFDTMTIASSFGPYAGGGTYNKEYNVLSFTYELSGNGPDPGRFTHINPHSLTTSSTSGGSVTTPGEGTFTYDEGENVNLVATPETGYHFVNWTGSVADANAASTTVTVTADTTVTAHFAANAKIEIDRVFSFSSHSSSYNSEDEITVITDRYTINTDPVILDNNDYDHLKLTLSPGPGKRFVVDDVSGIVTTQIGFRWNRNGAKPITAPPYTVTYTNGSGSLPGNGGGVVSLASNGSWILAGITLSAVTDSIAFDAVTFENSFGPYTGGGTYNIIENKIIFAYSLPGNVPDPGPFTHIVENPTLTTSSTVGGSVVDPGEGAFTYAYGTEVGLQAQPDPGYVFVNWSGNYSTVGNPITLVMDHDYHITANFKPESPSILYVDDDAPLDPGPGDSSISDPNEDGSPDHPYDSLQEAMDVAREGDTIEVAAGRYTEALHLAGKHLYLHGLDPVDGLSDLPVIDANGQGPVLSFDADADVTLQGLALTGGYDGLAGAVACQDSNVVLDHCLVAGNRFDDPNGGVLYLEDSNGVLINCTIADNAGLHGGAGLSLVAGHGVIRNSILWHNTPKEIQWQGSSTLEVAYSTITAGWPGPGNLGSDPLFAAPGLWVDANDFELVVEPNDPNAFWLAGDYHLMSTAGRWDPWATTWMIDDANSPALDAGDPLSDWSLEPDPNGMLINQGVYGGTSQASLSPE